MLTRAANHSKLWFAAALALVGFGGRMELRASVRAVGSLTMSSAIVNIILKPLARRARPSLAPVPEVRRLRRVPVSPSLPSGHAASAFAFAVGASTESPRLAALLFPSAALVAYSRVHVGVHYPGDVLAGAAVGAVVSLLTRVPWPRAAPARDDRPPRVMQRLPMDPRGGGLSIVVNLKSGSASAALDDVRARLPEASVIATGEAGLDRALERAAADCAVLGICGGDGSANRAAVTAAERGRPLLVIPGGTLNHMAHDLGVRSSQDVVDALDCGYAVPVDLAQLDGCSFLNVVSLGAYPDMVDRRDRLNHIGGRWLAQALALAAVLATGQPLTLRIDGRPRSVWMVFVGNCGYEPGGIHPAWRPRLDDGLLDVRVVDAAPRLARLRLLLAGAIGRLDQSPVYERWTASEVSIETDRQGLRLARDGDTFETGPSLTVTKRPQALLMLAPPTPAFAARAA